MESIEKNHRINIVLYAENESDAKGLTGKILSNKVSNSDIWRDSIDGVEVFGYIRSPSTTPTASPLGITDILLVHVTNADSEHWNSIKSYVDARRGIPFRFLTSANDLSSIAKELDCEFLNVNELIDAREKLVKSALNLEQSLRDAFNKIDIDQDGAVNEKEILEASSTLGHTLNNEDAKEIVNSLSSTGKISFEQFKQWWVMGRTDFSSFRKLVGIEMVVNNFIKQSSSTFNSYLAQIQKEGLQLTSQETGLRGRLNIITCEDFNSGIALGVHFSLGNDFDSIANALPSYLREIPISFGLEFHLKSVEQGPYVMEILNGVRELLTGLTDVGKIIESGVGINFRQVGTSIFIDVSYGGMSGDKINGLLSMFNFSSLNFSGSHDIHLTSKLSPVDLLLLPLEKVLESLTYLKLEAIGDYSNLKTVFTFVINTITLINGGKLSDQLKSIFYLLKLINIMKKAEFSLEYDPAVVYEVMIDFVNNFKEFNHQGEEFTTRFEWAQKDWELHKRPMFNLMIDNFSQMILSILAPYKSAITSIDLDKISAYLTCPILKIYAKINLLLRGVAEFIEGKFK